MKAEKKKKEYEIEPSVKQELQSAMVLSGVGYKEMAEYLGISVNSFYNKINGKTQFSIREASSIARKLKLDVKIFFKD